MALYKPSDAIGFAKAMIKSMPIDQAPGVLGTLQYQIVDYVASLFWTAAPWRWTLGTLAPIAITAAGGTDYTVTTTPSDFLYLNKANLSDGSLTNELKIVSSLAQSINQVGVPSQILYDTQAVSHFVRVSPKPPTNFSQTLTLSYKRTPPKIVAANFSTAGALGFPDAYFPILQAGVLWMAYQYADDQRTGSATVDQDGKLQFTQQLGVFQSMIAELRKSEKLTLDYPQVGVMHG